MHGAFEKHVHEPASQVDPAAHWIPQLPQLFPSDPVSVHAPLQQTPKRQWRPSQLGWMQRPEPSQRSRVQKFPSSAQAVKSASAGCVQRADPLHTSDVQSFPSSGHGVPAPTAV